MLDGFSMLIRETVLKPEQKGMSLDEREQRDYELKRLLEDVGHLIDTRMRELRMLVSDLSRLTKFTEDYIHKILNGKAVDISLHDVATVFYYLNLRISFDIAKKTPTGWEKTK